MRRLIKLVIYTGILLFLCGCHAFEQALLGDGGGLSIGGAEQLAESITTALAGADVNQDAEVSGTAEWLTAGAGLLGLFGAYKAREAKQRADDADSKRSQKTTELFRKVGDLEARVSVQESQKV